MGVAREHTGPSCHPEAAPLGKACTRLSTSPKVKTGPASAAHLQEGDDALSALDFGAAQSCYHRPLLRILPVIHTALSYSHGMHMCLADSYGIHHEPCVCMPTVLCSAEPHTCSAATPGWQPSEGEVAARKITKWSQSSQRCCSSGEQAHSSRKLPKLTRALESARLKRTGRSEAPVCAALELMRAASQPCSDHAKSHQQ